MKLTTRSKIYVSYNFNSEYGFFAVAINADRATRKLQKMYGYGFTPEMVTVINPDLYDLLDLTGNNPLPATGKEQELREAINSYRLNQQSESTKKVAFEAIDGDKIVIEAADGEKFTIVNAVSYNGGFEFYSNRGYNADGSGKIYRRLSAALRAVEEVIKESAKEAEAEARIKARQTEELSTKIKQAADRFKEQEQKETEAAVFVEKMPQNAPSFKVSEFDISFGNVARLYPEYNVVKINQVWGFKAGWQRVQIAKGFPLTKAVAYLAGLGFTAYNLELSNPKTGNASPDFKLSELINPAGMKYSDYVKLIDSLKL